MKDSRALEQYCTMSLHSTHTSTWMVEVELAQMLKHAAKFVFFYGLIFFIEKCLSLGCKNKNIYLYITLRDESISKRCDCCASSEDTV